MGMEPYQRSTHRAGFHAWIVAATAVAAIGMPAAAVAVPEQVAGVRPASSATADQLPQLDLQHPGAEADVTRAQLAGRVTRAWLADINDGKIHQAMSRMLLPSTNEAEHQVWQVLMDWSEHTVDYDLIAHRRAGHWAMSLCRAAHGYGDEGLLPIALYNPAADDPANTASQWWVVPSGHATDRALAPLYNADYHKLFAWVDRQREHT